MVGSVHMGGSLSDHYMKDYGCSCFGIIVTFIVIIVIIFFWPSAFAGQIIITGTPIDYVFSGIAVVVPIVVLVLIARWFSENRGNPRLGKELQF
ncbi:MAG: hypothetical protein ACFFEA_10020 [Candidatus Thorarchaeota archaeon]